MLNPMEMCQCEFENTVPKIFSTTLSEAVFKEKEWSRENLSYWLSTFVSV
jgi:hypothetical protein